MIQNYFRTVLMFLGAVIFICCSKATVPDVSENTVKQNVYYISPDGNSNAKGTIKDPLSTLNDVMSKLGPGDTVYLRGGNYYQQGVISRGGTAEKPIVFMAYPGETPVIDGSRLSVTGGQALISIENMSNIVIKNIKMANFITNDGGTDPEGIRITGASSNIHIDNCEIYNIKNNAPLSKGRGAHAILALGTAREPITGLKITGCSVHDTQTGTSENITLAGNVDGFEISGNTIYHTENIGIIIAAGDNLNPKGDVAVNYARNGVVRDNVLYDVTMGNSLDVWGDMYGAIAIYVCGGTNTIIERNVVYNSDRGIGLVSESTVF